MADKRKLIIIGGKGNGTVLASAVEDIISDNNHWELLGFTNDSHSQGDTLEGYPTLGKPENVVREYMRHEDCYFYFALIGAKVTIPRVMRLKQLESLGLPTSRFATLVHPTAVISKNVSLGYGVFISPFVYVGPETQIESHVYIHGQCYVARNSLLDTYAYLAPKVVVGAEVTLGKGAYLGTSSSTIERIKIGSWSVVGIGATVLHNVADYSIAIGSPAKTIGQVPFRWTVEGKSYEEVK